MYQNEHMVTVIHFCVMFYEQLKIDIFFEIFALKTTLCLKKNPRKYAKSLTRPVISI